MKRTWPEDWESRKRGDSCPFCAELSRHSFHSGRISVALLARQAIANGHVAVVFRGRHVADFTDLTPREIGDYWSDVQDAARLIARVFRPCHVNYLMLGNIVPHLHVHIVPRFLDDPAPGRPLPWEPVTLPDELFAAQLRELREAASSSRHE